MSADAHQTSPSLPPLASFPLGARGERPVFIATNGMLPRERYLSILDIPGVVRAPGGFRCTWDSAWAVSILCGQEPAVVPLSDSDSVVAAIPGLPGLEEYRSLGFPSELRPYQKESAAFMALRAWAMCCDPMRCLSGDSELIVNRAGCARRVLLRDLVFKFNGGHTRGRCWQRDMPTYVAAYDGTGSCIGNRVVRAATTGRHETYTVRTASGAVLSGSAEHAVLTPDGYALLADLRVGASVIVRYRPTSSAKGCPRPNPYRVWSVRNHPHARHYQVERSGRPGEVVHHVLVHRLAYEAYYLNGLALDVFVERIRQGRLDDLEFLPPDYHVRHKDSDPQNNAPTNLVALSSVEHSRQRAEEGAYRRVLLGVREERIEEVQKGPPIEMFDLEMAEPYRNYIANGIVVHNSGKTVSALAAAILVGARKVLIVCPALPRLGWAEEIARWVRHEAVLCEGRAAEVVRIFCRACNGTGRVANAACGECRLLNGQSRGLRLIDASHGRCTKHGHECSSCRADLEAALESARFTITNYELLSSQLEKDAAGG